MGPALLGAAAIPAEAFAANKGKAKGKLAAKKFFTPSQTALVTALVAAQPSQERQA